MSVNPAHPVECLYCIARTGGGGLRHVVSSGFRGHAAESLQTGHGLFPLCEMSTYSLLAA